MQNATTKSPTTYVIRPSAYPGHFVVSFARQDGSHGHAGGADGFRGAVEIARCFATDGDRIVARKSLYVGDNFGAWHAIGRA